VVGAIGVEELHVAGAEDFEAIVEVGSRGEGLRAEAGAWVVDFEELDGLRGAVADCCGNVRGVAACGGNEAGEKCESGDAAHERQEYQGEIRCG